MTKSEKFRLGNNIFRTRSGGYSTFKEMSPAGLPKDFARAYSPRVPLGRLCVFLSLLCLSPLALAESPLTTCAAIRGLPRDMAARRMPVTVRGTVTFCQPSKFGGLILQDSIAGIYVDRANSRDAGLVSPDVPWPGLMPRGTLVEVEGVTGEGHFAPILCPREIRVLGTGPLPEPIPLAISEVLDGKWDCQSVRLRGVVQFAELRPNHADGARMELVANGGRIALSLNDPPPDIARLVDAEIEVSGVIFTYFNNRGELVGVWLEVTGTNNLRVLTSGPVNPFEAPEVQIATLRPFSPAGTSFHRCRCRGVVTLARRGQYFYMQENGRGIRVETPELMPLAPGDRVEAAGFVEVADHFGKLRGASIRKLSGGSRPESIAVTRRRILGTAQPGSVTNADDTDGAFASLRGKLEKVDLSNGDGPRIFLESEGHLVTGTFAGDTPQAALLRFEPGSELQINGIVRVELASGWPAQAYPTPTNFQMLIHEPGDVVVLRPAPWWTPRRLWFLLGGICAALAMTLAWNWLLRRRVEERSAELAQEMRARHEASVEFEATLRERERLAADLHDNLEQSLTSLALQLEAGEALRQDAPERSAAHFKMARQVLARGREEVRRSVWNLRSQTLEGRTLPEALRDVAGTLCDGRSATVEIASEGRVRILPDFVAGNLLLLAQEAMTNALKHAAPTHIRVSVAFAERAVRLTVEDDGKGFDPGGQPGPREGHFGLQGMRERMKRLGGFLELKSAPGAGTQVAAEVPGVE